MADSSKKDRLITLQYATATRSGSGQENKTWADLANVWAEKVERSGREYFAADQVVGEVDTLFKIRYRDGVNNQMRVSYQQQVYDIRAVQEIGRREDLMLVCQIVRMTS